MRAASRVDVRSSILHQRVWIASSIPAERQTVRLTVPSGAPVGKGVGVRESANPSLRPWGTPRPLGDIPLMPNSRGEITGEKKGIISMTETTRLNYEETTLNYGRNGKNETKKQNRKILPR